MVFRHLGNCFRHLGEIFFTFRCCCLEQNEAQSVKIVKQDNELIRLKQEVASMQGESASGLTVQELEEVYDATITANEEQSVKNMVVEIVFAFEKI